VTAVAELGLLLNQKVLGLLAVVRRVAVGAADSAIGMGRLAEVILFFGASMTTETTCAGLLAREILKADDLADVAAAVNVSGPWSVTVLATVLAFFQEREMSRPLKVLAVDIVVAGLARVCSDVRTSRRIRSTLTRCRLHLLRVGCSDREESSYSNQKHRNRSPAPESHRQVASMTEKHLTCHN
jgi:hypothetical protein